jgi:hypothetical protein
VLEPFTNEKFSFLATLAGSSVRVAVKAAGVSNMEGRPYRLWQFISLFVDVGPIDFGTVRVDHMWKSTFSVAFIKP